MEDDSFLKRLNNFVPLITLIGSLLIAILIMYLYDVKPWKDAEDINFRKKVVYSHINLGQKFLDEGYYENAEKEFDLCLGLDPSNPKAIDGKQKASILKQIDNDEVNSPAIWSYIDFYKNIDQDYNMLFIRGRLCQLTDRPENIKEALELYIKARSNYRKKHTCNEGKDCKCEYYDCLGYLQNIYHKYEDLEKMKTIGDAMIGAKQHDPRGYNVNIIYLVTIARKKIKQDVCDLTFEDDLKKIYDLINMSRPFLKNSIIIIGNIGDTLRFFDPDKAIEHHKQCLDIINTDHLYNLPINRKMLGVILSNEPKGRRIKIKKTIIALAPKM